MPATLAPTRTTSTSTDLPTCSVYVRISRDTERTRLGVDRQMKGCRELAARLGYRIAATYDDNDTSAYSGKKRKGYLRMLDDLERNPTPVLVWHTDRLHRSPLELEGWINLAEANNITVHTVISGPIDLATPAGRMNARQVVANAKYESEIKSLRLKDKMVEKAEFGEWLGGSRPFGWQFIDPTVKPRRLELNPAEAELIATGIRTLLAGGSLRVVVRDFTASKVPPPYATAWHRRSVRTILRRWRNAGLLEHRGQIVGPAEWPAIPGVSADDVKAVRELLAERAEGNNYGNKADWLLSGIAYCHCGEHVRATSNRPDRMTYRCVTAGRGHVAKAIEPVDELVNTFMVAWLSDPDRFATRYAATATTGVDVAALRVEREPGTGTTRGPRRDAGQRRDHPAGVHRHPQARHRARREGGTGADRRDPHVTRVRDGIERGPGRRMGRRRPRREASDPPRDRDDHAAADRGRSTPVQPGHGADRAAEVGRRRQA